MRSLCSGATRAKIVSPWARMPRKRWSSISETSAPVNGLQWCVLPQADLLANAGGRQRVVAGDHDDADAGGVAGMDGCRCDFRPHRIGQRHQAQVDQGFLSISADVKGAPFNSAPSRKAKARTRKPRSAMASFFWRIRARSSSLSGRMSSPQWMRSHWCKRFHRRAFDIDRRVLFAR